MRIVKHKKCDIEFVVGFTCHVCGKTYNDDTELQESLHFHNVAGYNSVFGDGNEVFLDICQHCLKEKFEKYIQVKGKNQ